MIELTLDFKHFTFLYQAAIFLFLVFVLDSLLFQPVLRVLEKRKNATTGAQDEIAHLKKTTEEKIKEYENRIQKAKIEASELKDKIKKEGEEKANALLAQARKNADEYLKTMDARLKTEIEGAREFLKNNREVLAKQLASQATGMNLS